MSSPEQSASPRSERLERARTRFDSGDHKKALADLWTAEADLSANAEGLEAVKELAMRIRDEASSRVASEADMLIRQVGVRLAQLSDERVRPPQHRFRVGMPVTTALELPGFDIAEYVGEVFGVIVRSRGALPAFGANLKAVFGGELKTMTNLLDQSRREAVDRMVAEAEERGANAVISMRFDADSIADGWTEICAYGTAVRTTQSEGR